MSDSNTPTDTHSVNQQGGAEVQKHKAFEVYLHAVFTKDAARAEAYGQARLALAVANPTKVAGRLMGTRCRPSLP